MTETTDQFLAMRSAWVAKGRPSDMGDPYWRSVVSSAADRVAVDFGYVRPAPVAPLVVLR